MFRSFIFAASLCLAGTALAQDNAPDCETRGTNAMVTAVLCPAGLSDTALAQAGQTACDGRTPCGAWIWVDEAALPDEVPASHDGLSRDQITSAVAVWVNETSQLVTLQKDN